uniref:Uncharacterized protein n=1 Tax=uncultured bacterium contig00048 TaxID=1181533 RepID=A0A806KS94_9BACT|nr:hypothetical protein [uncultured bacterium contig00048]
MGITNLCDEPNRRRAICGTIKSTNPITPTKAITLPPSSLPAPRRMSLNIKREKSFPRSNYVSATLSPSGCRP